MKPVAETARELDYDYGHMTLGECIRVAEETFSEQARGEIAQMKEVSLRAIGLLQELDGVSVERLSEISAFEQKMDDMTLAFRQNQIWRMHEGVCSDEACILYSEMLTDFERIGDHILNIGQELASAGFPR